MKKKYKVRVIYTNTDEVEVYAKNEEDAKEKAYSQLYIDGTLIDETVEEIEDEETEA